MRRRAVLAGGAVAALPAGAARGQSSPVVGFLSAAAAEPARHLAVAFVAGLGEAGFIEGRTVAVEGRWAAGDYDRLPELARELVARRVAVIMTGGGEVAAVAARAVAGDTPVLFVMGSDPARAGLVASLARPGGTVTGIVQFAPELAAKRFGLLRDALPRATRFGLLLNPTNPISASQREAVVAAAARTGVGVTVVEVGGLAPFEPAFDAMARDGVEALLIGGDATFDDRRAALAALAASRRLPAIHSWCEFAAAGGLMSYGAVLADMYRQAGVYAGRILKGERPADLPVAPAARFELVVNMRTARALGLDLPPGFVAQIDEAIK